LQPSLIRLGFLATVPTNKIIGRIGFVNKDLKTQLLLRLSEYLTG
jgi:hypothetical protein